MPKPEGEYSCREIQNELSLAEQFGRAKQWCDADAAYGRACLLDRSPGSRIAFGSSLALRERYHDAICQLTGALDVASTDGDREALGVIFHNLAAIYRELGDFDLARRFQQRALLQLDDCGPSELLGLANDAWLSQRPELAVCLSSSCEDLASEDDGDLLDLEARATAAVMTGLTEDPRAGIRVLIRAYQQHVETGEDRFAGIDLLNLSLLMSAVGRYQTEIHLVRSAIRHFEQAAAPVSAARARLILANLERMQALRSFDPSVN